MAAKGQLEIKSVHTTSIDTDRVISACVAESGRTRVGLSTGSSICQHRAVVISCGQI